MTYLEKRREARSKSKILSGEPRTLNTENTMRFTNCPPSRDTTYHRDGTVTVWDCLQQLWVRGNNPSDELLATLGSDELEKIIKHTA